MVYPKLLVLIKKARETNPNTVLVDSGDTIQGTPFGTYKALIDPVAQGVTHPMYKAFEMLGYDAETLGNHEFNYGLEFLDRMVKTARINIINANVRNAQTGDYYYNPYKIVNKTFTDTDGKQVTLKIGITGVLPTQILVWDKANLEGKVTVDDPMEAVKTIVPQMKAAGADLFLLLLILVLATMNILRTRKMKVTKLLVSKVLMLLRQDILMRISQMVMVQVFMPNILV